ncbi:MAG: ABC transporter permease [Acidimicrobiales bacterium]
MTRSHLSLRDLANEVTIGLTARPARTLLTALGTIIGVASLVATLGLAKTAGNRIVSRFDELEATTVTVTPSNDRVSLLPFDAESRLDPLNGVVASGTKSDVAVGDRLARSVPVVDPLGQTEFQIPVIAVSPGLFDAARARLATGSFFDAGHDARSDPVAILGPGAAERLNVGRVDNSPSIFLGDETLAVVGILAEVERQPALLNAIIVPNGYARSVLGLQAPELVLIEVDVGAADLIGTQAPVALAPGRADQLQAQVPAAPTRVRSDVADDVNALFLILGAVSLLVGAIGIANVTLVSVLERTGEIGLRRALGATRRHIASQFLAESAALGALAGLFGTSLGILTVVAVAAARQWSPVLDPWLPFAAPLLGAVIGLVAGTYPAWKASRLEPIDALRGL